MDTGRAPAPAGQRIKIQFGDERSALLVDVGETAGADDLAALLVDCLEAGSFDEAEGRLQAGLDGLDGSVRRSP